MAELVVTSGGDERLFRLDEDSVVIGRAPGCAIQIDDIHSSRRHAQVIRVQRGFEVVDLGSRNGTLVNGKRLDRKLLRHGDVVRIGEVEIRYEDPDTADAASAADEGDIVLEDVGGGAPAADEGVSSLQFRSGDRDGETVTLSADRTTIGRKRSNAVVVRDAMCSSYHCEITRESGGYIIRDLGSTNGTVVNGEMISEMALNHGARIRIGGTKLVFVDPTMAAFGESFDDEDDAGDWGMMREIDTSAVPKRGLQLLPLVVLFVVAAAIAGGFYLMADDPASQGPTVESPAGNLLTPGLYSFEGEGAAANFTTPTGAHLATTGGGKTGRHALRLSRGDREGPVAARFPEGVDINPERRYRLEGFVKAGEGVSATLRISFRLRGGVRTPWLATAAPVAGAGGFRKTSITVSPPRGAVELEALLVLCEGGAASFDDVTVTDAGALAPPVKVRAGGFDFVVDDAGVFGVARDGEWVLMSGSFIARLDDGTLLDGCGGLEDLEVAPDGSGVTVKGAFPRPSGDPVPFTATVTAADELVTFALEATAARVGLAVVSDRNLLLEPVYLLGPDVREARLGPFARVEKLTRITFGASAKRLGAAPAAAGADLAAFLAPEGDDLRLFLDVPGDGEGAVGIQIRTSFSAQKNEALELARRARSLASNGAAGKATVVCQRIIVGYSFCESEVTVAESISKAMAEMGRLEEGRARRALEAGRQFMDLHALRQAEILYAALAKDWAGLPRGELGKTNLALVRGLLAETRLEEARAEARGELARARDLKATGKPSLAAAVFRSIVGRFGDLKDVGEVAEAKQALAELSGE